jgi:hypothetical protein
MELDDHSRSSKPWPTASIPTPANASQPTARTPAPTCDVHHAALLILTHQGATPGSERCSHRRKGTPHYSSHV